MAVGRAERWNERKPRAPPEEVVDDVLLCSGGTLAGLVGAAHLAVIDRRDLAVWASEIRRKTGDPA